LALQGIAQPSEDIHQWNKDNVFKGKFDRKKCKQMIFAWMYNPMAIDSDIESVYNKTEILKKHYRDGIVDNGYRTITCDPHHALSYLIQSLSSDIFMRNAIKIYKILKNRKSKVAFLMHDSVIIDASNEDFQGDGVLLNKVTTAFKQTDFGEFRINISTGQNYGSMEQTKEQYYL
jgi:DNA polymerase I-like protein with 3'-5' exonuclease and polymerase domains